MPISETGNSHEKRARNARGFTLVETLVVVLIMGLLAGAVVFTAPGAGGKLRDDARKLAARTTLIGQESIVSGLPMGMKLTHEGYVFFRMESGIWEEMIGEKIFLRHSWPQDVVVQIGQVENQVTRTPSVATPVPETPNVIFDPTGISTPFVVSLSMGEETYVVSKNEKGDIVVRTAQK
jgi:general secretion pathway protein H